MANIIDRVIAKANGNMKVIDFRDNLVPGGENAYAMLHGIGGAKHAAKSTIKVTICDYSRGKGNNSVTVSANLTPEVTNYLYEVSKQALMPSCGCVGSTIGTESVATLQSAKTQLANVYRLVASTKENKDAFDVDSLLSQLGTIGKGLAAVITDAKTESVSTGPKLDYSQDRVNPYSVDANGTAPVARMLIARNGVRQDGSISRYPWMIRITNGNARLIKKENGSCTFDGKTFQKTNEAFINVSDMDMFSMLTKCQHFIAVWENALCLNQVLTGVKAVQAEREHYLQQQGA